MISRRQFFKLSAATGVGLAVSGTSIGTRSVRIGGLRASAVVQMAGLSDPALQPKFRNPAPNALDPGFKFDSPNGKYKITMQQTAQMTGLVGTDGVTPVPTPVWGYGENGKGVTWPGRTFEVQKDQPTEVKWENKLLDAAGNPLPHLLPVDTTMHWAYSLHGYTQYSIAANGVPTVAHLHGGHTDSPFDGKPEYFFSPGWCVRGPR